MQESATWIAVPLLGIVFGVLQLVSQLATGQLWKLEKAATGRHAVYPWSLAYWVWMFSTPSWMREDPEALELLRRQRVYASASGIAMLMVVIAMMLTAALTGASS